MITNKTIRRALFLATLISFLLIPINVSAATRTVNFKDKGDPATNRRELNKIIESNSSKVVNITSDIKIDTFLRPGSNTTINAGNHTVTIMGSDKGAITNVPKKTDYSAIQNVNINGGIWQVANNSAKSQSIMRLAHANNIKFSNVKIYSGYEDHSVELIACKNVTFYKCNFIAQGSCKSSCLEEQLQIDIADKYTAPGIKDEAGAKFVNGAPCKNITINSCTISGARGVCANYTKKNPSNCKAKNFHSKIVIKNSTITGKSAEAVSMFNTKSGSVTNCKIITNAPVKRGAYSVGLHVAYQSKSKPPKASTKNAITIKNNTVKGGRQAIQVYSHVGTKYGQVTVSNNKAYCKKGKKSAIKADKKVAKKLVKNKNKTYKW